MMLGFYHHSTSLSTEYPISAVSCVLPRKKKDQSSFSNTPVFETSLVLYAHI